MDGVFLEIVPVSAVVCMKQMMSTLPPVVFFRELQNGHCLYIYCLLWYIFTEVQSGQFLHCLLWYFFSEVQSGQCLYCLFWYLFHRGTKWTMSILPVVVFVSQRYKVDNVYTACCGICFTEVQSGPCLYCLLWHFSQRDTRWTMSVLLVLVFVSQRYKVDNIYTACCGICFTEVPSGQCLYCLFWYLFHWGTKWTIPVLPVVVFFLQRYKVNNVYTAYCGVCFTEVQSGPCLYCLLWHFSHRDTRWTMSVLPVLVFVSQRYKVDNIYTACHDICFTEVQSGQCLYCLLWYFFHRGIKWTMSVPPAIFTSCCGYFFFTEVHSEQWLCLYTILHVVVVFAEVHTQCLYTIPPAVVFFHRGT